LIYYRFAIAAALCFCFTLSATAQKLFTVTGVVFKKSSQERVSKVIISNLTRNSVTSTDDLGTFRIQAAAGDSLLFKKMDYTNQTVAVLNDNLLPVYLQPIVVLDEVKIKETSKRQDLANTMKNYQRSGGYYDLHPSVGSVVSHPLSGLYDLFGKAPTRARKFQQYSKDEMEHAAITRRYSKELIKKITNIDDNEIDSFILTFSPTYEDIKVWSDYDIINYIKKSFDYFQRNKAAMKSQKLY
jgi:hypothetical protein